MRGSGLVAGVLSVLVLGAVTVPSPGADAAAEQAPPPEHQLVVSGTGTDMYPDFDPDVQRYAIRTTGGTAGSVSLDVSTSDEAGTISVDGRPLTDGRVTVDGLESGDEISVLIDDGAGESAYSLIYLPPGFPELTTSSSGAGPAPGLVFLALTDFFGGPRFEAVVDRHGVPVHVQETVNSMDLKRQPNGHYSAARSDSIALDATYDVVELDEQFREIDSHQTVGLENTDFHDSILQPDGSRYLMAYEPNDETGLIDSVVQHVGADGSVLFEWSTADHVDPDVDGLTPLADYAHLNSLDVMADGDLLLSFRHLSQVIKVARTAHDGFAVGDVVWRLGGRRSDFSFPTDEYAGPCAQHTARELENGSILIFGNGSQVTETTLTPMCPDPADPAGDRIERPQTRLVAFDLDEESGSARVDWSWERPGLFAEFAGSAQRLPGGHTLAGFAAADPDVIEVDADGNEVWELDLPVAFSYRALKFEAPDATPPAVQIEVPADGAELVEGSEVTTQLRCTDRGGSGLAACRSTRAHGERLDTTPGTHTVDVEATDGAGNTTTVSHAYTVLHRWEPDAMLRRDRGDSWQGKNVIGRAQGQRVRVGLGRTGAERTVQVRIRNNGTQRDRVRLDGSHGNRKFTVTWLDGRRDVTDRVVAGTYRTPRLKSGKSHRLKVRVTRRPRADDGDRRRVKLVARSGHQSEAVDRVQVKVRAR